MKRGWRVAWPIETGPTETGTMFQDHLTEGQAREHEARIRSAGGLSGDSVITFPVTLWQG